ncbi:uncharacterized protein LOC111431421 isoform X3 [Cucurbita moschata]|uniref:Uncharacterized protein LOC111431421 isoform X3 n=1 Tax=Cucurbita moschata TaxID=3662 RepID=A0A6J1ED07_CUCMO|nr:uncharacterized protein LOC111431421 isoform X3 [Cucurbita moschata]
MNSVNTKATAVLYHYPCPDGAFAALAAHLYFSAASLPPLFFPNTVYNPLRTDQLPLHQIDDVYLLDFVGPFGFVEDLSSKVNRVIILDHHKTALEKLSDESSFGENVTKVIDIQRSGATIAFDYFKQKLIQDAYGNFDVGSSNYKVLNEFERMRRLYEYIEDGDLWKWSLPNSKALSSGFKDLNIEYDTLLNPNLFDQLVCLDIKCLLYRLCVFLQLLSLDMETMISRGIASLAHKQKLIEDALNQSYSITLGGGAFGRCLAVDADSISELRSELGHQLATKSQNSNLREV